MDHNDTEIRPTHERYVPDPRPLYGLELRYVLTDLIDGPEKRVWTVAELVIRLEGGGFTLSGRASKEISDHLRAEVNRGRVLRVGRGRYRPGHIPGSTRRRIRKRARARWDGLALAGPRHPYRAPA